MRPGDASAGRDGMDLQSHGGATSACLLLALVAAVTVWNMPVWAESKGGQGDRPLEKLEDQYFKIGDLSRLQQGLEIVNRRLRQNKKDAPALYLRGVGNKLQGYTRFASNNAGPEVESLMQAAISSFDQAATLGYNKPMLLYHRGEARLVLHMARLARQRAALSSRPDRLDDPLWGMRGAVFAALNDGTSASMRDPLISLALRDLEDANRAMPKYAYGWGALGMTMGAQGRYEEAQKALKRAIDLTGGKDPNCWYEQAVVCLASRNFRAGKEALNHCIRLAPGNFVHYMMRALCAYQLKDFPSAQADLDYVLSHEPGNKIALDMKDGLQSSTTPLDKIESQYYNGCEWDRCQKGLIIVNQRLRQNPKDPFAVYLRALGAHCKGYSKFASYKNAAEIDNLMAEAISSYNQAQRLGYSPPLLYYHRGEAKVVRHMAAVAKRKAAQKDKLDPEKDWVWAARGMIYAAITDISPESRNDPLIVDALKDINEALRLNPAFDQTWGALGMAQAAQGKFGEARNSIKHAIDLTKGKNATVFYELGVICMEMKDYRAAYNAMNEAIKLVPNNSVHRLLRAQAALKLGNLKQAQSDLDYVIAHEPDNAAALTLQSAVGLKQNQPEQAMADLLAADEIHNKVKGQKRERIQAAQARKVLEKTASQNRMLGGVESAQTAYDDAILNFGLRHFEKSAQQFEKVLKLSKTTGATEMHCVALAAIAYASVNHMDKSAVLLHKHVVNADKRGVPGKIVKYLAAQIDEKELDKYGRTNEDRTLIDFYIGCKHARFKEYAKARERFNRVVENGDQKLDQYLLAVMELDALSTKGKVR